MQDRTSGLWFSSPGERQSPNLEWANHAYPLQQAVVRLQGTRHSDRANVINQLEEVLARLRAGESRGYEHADDFGYTFEYLKASDVPSFFGATPTGKG